MTCFSAHPCRSITRWLTWEFPGAPRLSSFGKQRSCNNGKERELVIHILHMCIYLMRGVIAKKYKYQTDDLKLMLFLFWAENTIVPPGDDSGDIVWWLFLSIMIPSSWADLSINLTMRMVAMNGGMRLKDNSYSIMLEVIREGREKLRETRMSTHLTWMMDVLQKML